MKLSGGIRVNSHLVIPRSEIRVSAARSGGPGGQKVNKAATKVVLRFSVDRSEALGERRRGLIRRRLGHRLTEKGEIVLHAGQRRERARNLQDATQRLASLLRAALAPVKPRIKTRPTASSRRRRLEQKRRRGQRKQSRRYPEKE